MKIYKELILQANPTKNEFTKVSEISEEYDGPIAKLAYLSGDSEIDIHCYYVFIRNHATATVEPWTTAITAITSADTVLKETGADWYSATITDGVLATSCKEWGIIGRLDEKPTVKTSDGQTINLESCDVYALSEIIEVNLSHLQVNAGNWKQLRAMAKTGNVDMIFVEKTKISGDPIEGVGISNIKINVQIEITGNDKNTMPITAKKEIGDVTTNFDLIAVTGT